MGASLNGMLETFEGVIAQVQRSTTQTADASRQLASGSEQLSSGAGEQASSIEETSASLEEMSASITQNAENSKRMEEMAVQGVREGEESEKAVSETLARDEVDRREDLLRRGHRLPDEPPRPERRHRGGAGRRARARLRGRRRRGPQARRAQPGRRARHQRPLRLERERRRAREPVPLRARPGPPQDDGARPGGRGGVPRAGVGRHPGQPRDDAGRPGHPAQRGRGRGVRRDVRGDGDAGGGPPAGPRLLPRRQRRRRFRARADVQAARRRGCARRGATFFPRRASSSPTAPRDRMRNRTVTSGASEPGARAARPDASPIATRVFRGFRAVIRRESGISLSDAKKALLVGRLGRRLRDLGIDSYEEYLERVEADAGERVLMLDAIATNETHFFREPTQFDVPQGAASSRAGSRRRRRGSGRAASGSGAPAAPRARSRTRSRCSSRRSSRGTGTSRSARPTSRRRRSRAPRAAVWPLERAREIPPALLKTFMLRGTGPEEGRMKAGPELRALVKFERLNLADETLGRRRPVRRDPLPERPHLLRRRGQAPRGLAAPRPPRGRAASSSSATPRA